MSYMGVCTYRNALRDQLSVSIPLAQRVADRVHLRLAFPPLRALGGLKLAKVVNSDIAFVSSAGRRGDTAYVKFGHDNCDKGPSTYGIRF